MSISVFPTPAIDAVGYGKLLAVATANAYYTSTISLGAGVYQITFSGGGNGYIEFYSGTTLLGTLNGATGTTFNLSSAATSVRFTNSVINNMILTKTAEAISTVTGTLFTYTSSQTINAHTGPGYALLVGGGGSGGNGGGGYSLSGGGGSGYLAGGPVTFTSGMSLTVGNGGTVTNGSYTAGQSGNATTFSNYTAAGGSGGPEGGAGNAAAGGGTGGTALLANNSSGSNGGASASGATINYFFNGRGTTGGGGAGNGTGAGSGIGTGGNGSNNVNAGAGTGRGSGGGGHGGPNNVANTSRGGAGAAGVLYVII
jgi:hypothetical protein